MVKDWFTEVKKIKVPNTTIDNEKCYAPLT